MSAWIVQSGSTVVHDDDDAHVALVLRTLQIEAAVWRRTLDSYAELLRMAPGEPAPEGRPRVPLPPEVRLAALRDAYARHSPHAAQLPADLPRPICTACGAASVPAVLARRPGPLVYGRCGACGHGVLLATSSGERGEGATGDVASFRQAPAPPPPGAGYYQRRTATGVGYDDYLGDRAYREQKGERLLDRVAELVKGASPRRPRTLLEVGSGFGFTRAAAERRGIATTGVDVNPEAAREAARLHGFMTVTGTLASALADAGSQVRAGGADLVLYQFVLEHVADPVGELRAAASALAPDGTLVLLVPSMEAREVDVFAASYRSFRADHLHLFSRASARQVLGRAGLRCLHIESTCNVHLLHGMLDRAELNAIYDGGLGPDLLILARRGS